MSLKRLIDLIISLIGIFAFSVPMLIVAIFVRSTSSGGVIFWSERVGKNGKLFKMPKFRTMYQGAPIVATHLIKRPHTLITPVGAFLRKSSLDELPQLWSILIGDMSLVGPRPALESQKDLIMLRQDFGISKMLPGLTGWAQVNGRDELPVSVKVQYEIEYLNNQSFLFDIKILGLTFLKVFQRSGISH